MNFKYDNLYSFNSRRSPLYAKHGMVGASHPLAAEAGLSILKLGGNAADAAVATAAVLNVVEPMSTGVGGDCFCLFFDASTKQVYGLNGSGRSPKKLTLSYLKDLGISGDTIPSKSAHAITVPGTVAGWIDTLTHFGSMNISDVLKPAIKISQEGFPVSPIISVAWKLGRSKLRRSTHGNELLINGRSPKIGEIFQNPYLTKVFQEISRHGKKGFYSGWIADEIVQVISNNGGLMTHNDLLSHESEIVKPISTHYRNKIVYEIPPNGQGITALLALNLLEGFDLPNLIPNGSKFLHLLIESLRLAFADSRYFVADMEQVSVPVYELLSKSYADSRRNLIDFNKANPEQTHGTPIPHSDTVYLATADFNGNACSFINSNYQSFGTGIVPKSTGFVLQNRGSCFSLIEGHPNVLKPNKRPYHTIIPGMATELDGNLYACFGIMGGYNQPQAHVQALSKLIDYGYNPQAALDSLRFTILGGVSQGKVALEEGMDARTIAILKKMGHDIEIADGIGRSILGNGQIILRDNENETWIGGSDPRCDGCVIGY